MPFPRSPASWQASLAAGKLGKTPAFPNGREESWGMDCDLNKNGGLLVHRFATIVLSLGLLLGLTGAHHLLAGDDPKKDETSKSEPAKPEAAKTEPAKEGEKAKEKEATPKPE